MLQVVKQTARRVLGPRVTAALRRMLKAPPRLAATPVEHPKRLLFLSDCYAQDVTWGPFHKTMLAYCGAAFERVLAIRANAFFHPWSHEPLSEQHLAAVRRAIEAFAPDLVFSINRAGLSERTLEVVRPHVKALTVFVDYYDRLEDSMHRYGPRDLVWGTGTATMSRAFLAKYGGRLRPEQVLHTLWGVDHHLFYPRDVQRETGIIFVGTPFNPEAFVNLLDAICHDEHNRRVFLETYETHRKQFIYDWPRALERAGFAFERVPAPALPLFENYRLQAAVGDQISIENRITCLAALAGMDVKIYGDSTRQWLQDFSIAGGLTLKHFQFRPVLDPEELVRLYASAKIGVNIQHEHARQHGLSFRVFDLMATGTMLASHGDSKQVLEEIGFVDGKDYVCFHDPARLRRLCAYYLRNERRRRAIAASGYRKVRAGHTLAHRFAAVFRGFGYPVQAAGFDRLTGATPNLLDAERILQEKVTTLASGGC